MAEFLMLFLGFKSQNTYKFDQFISIKAKLTLDCLRNYSMKKFQYITKFEELKILMTKIYNCNLDELFSGAKTMETNRERYINAIEELIDTN